MIAEFVSAWDANQSMLREKFSAEHPADYTAVVRAVVEMLAATCDGYDVPDPERIHVIDDGDYQGVQIFVIGANGYQPSRYWYVKVGYGSCSGCDTLQSICSYSSEPPTEQQTDDYMTLALHIVQKLHQMDESSYV